MVLQARPGSRLTAVNADTPTASTGDSLNWEHPGMMDAPIKLWEIKEISNNLNTGKDEILNNQRNVKNWFIKDS